MPRAETGVSRGVFYSAWCRRMLCDWHGPERDVRWMAELDRAAHEVDRHGGRSTRAEERDAAAS